MGYLIGIDVGSTNYKAVACSYEGAILSIATRSGDTIYKDNGWAEIDPQKMWENVAACIKEVINSLPGKECLGIGVASNGEDVLLKSDGTPAYPTIRWFDTRTNKSN